MHTVVGRGHTALSIVGRLSALRSVHYGRFHCTYTVCTRTKTIAVLHITHPSSPQAMHFVCCVWKYVSAH